MSESEGSRCSVRLLKSSCDDTAAETYRVVVVIVWTGGRGGSGITILVLNVGACGVALVCGRLWFWVWCCFGLRLCLEKSMFVCSTRFHVLCFLWRRPVRVALIARSLLCGWLAITPTIEHSEPASTWRVHYASRSFRVIVAEAQPLPSVVFAVCTHSARRNTQDRYEHLC